MISSNFVSMSKQVVSVERGVFERPDFDCCGRFRCSQGDDSLSQNALRQSGNDYHFLFAKSELKQAGDEIVYDAIEALSDINPLKVIYYAKPWWLDFRFPDETVKNPLEIYVPLMAKLEDCWLDGPIVVRGPKGIVSFIPSGVAARLRWDVTATSSDELIQLDKHAEAIDEGYLNSMQVFVSSALVASGDELVVAIDDFSLPTMIAVTILKKTLGSRKLILQNKLDYKQWPASMKRVCQNIGLNMYEGGGHQGTAVTDISFLVKQVAYRTEELARCVNRFSAVIPTSLLR